MIVGKDKQAGAESMRSHDCVLELAVLAQRHRRTNKANHVEAASKVDHLVTESHTITLRTDWTVVLGIVRSIDESNEFV
jgi:hypothetical protein